MASGSVFDRGLGLFVLVQAVSAMVALPGKLIEASSPGVFGRLGLGFAYFLLLLAFLGILFSGSLLAGRARVLGARARLAGLGFMAGSGLSALGALLELLALIASSTLAFKAGLLLVYLGFPLLVAAEAIAGVLLIEEARGAGLRAAWGASVLYTGAPILAVFMNGVGWVLGVVVAATIIYAEAALAQPQRSGMGAPSGA